MISIQILGNWGTMRHGTNVFNALVGVIYLIVCFDEISSVNKTWRELYVNHLQTIYPVS